MSNPFEEHLISHQVTPAQVEQSQRDHKLWREQIKAANLARRRGVRAIAKTRIEVQTYWIVATLSCGHRTSFTLSAKAYNAGKWTKRKFGCKDCFPAPPFPGKKTGDPHE